MKEAKEITAKLLTRRDEYRKQRKKRITAAAAALLFIAAMAAVIPVALEQGRQEAPKPLREAVSYDRIRRPAGDPWYGSEYVSEGWYNEPVESGFEGRPAGVCVRMELGGEDMMFNIANEADIDRLTELIRELEPVHDNSPEPGREGIEYVVMLSRGRRIFRLTKFSDGRFAVNDIGYFRLDGKEEAKLSGFVNTQAVMAANVAKREYVEIDGEMIVAYTTFAAP